MGCWTPGHPKAGGRNSPHRLPRLFPPGPAGKYSEVVWHHRPPALQALDAWPAGARPRGLRSRPVAYPSGNAWAIRTRTRCSTRDFASGTSIGNRRAPVEYV